jgi:hypothetical protein
MRRILWTAAIGLTVAGCRGPRATAPAAAPASAKPVRTLVGRIASVNPKLRYVVISFQSVPALDTRLNVYRANLKVAEVSITRPQQNNLTAADIITGECQIGDEVRPD